MAQSLDHSGGTFEATKAKPWRQLPVNKGFLSTSLHHLDNTPTLA
jgi:hypothetical protein